MADVIINQNIIQIFQRPDGVWTAILGPLDGQGILATGTNPFYAVQTLLGIWAERGWIFDPDYHPREIE